MGWWRHLKMRQNLGILFGGGHFLFYSILLLLALNHSQGESGIGYLLILVELPWMGLLDMIFGDAFKVMPINFGRFSLLIYGTLGYILIGFAIGLGFDVIRGRRRGIHEKGDN